LKRGGVIRGSDKILHKGGEGGKGRKKKVGRTRKTTTVFVRASRDENVRGETERIVERPTLREALRTSREKIRKWTNYVLRGD